ncbi:MAG: amino acid ABC transporter ATP-binding protein [Clostridia bacterium]|nr:amino acid ABC transporter ATP-binding protein [Clostridia bacterium]
MFENLLEIRELTKSFGNNDVLKGVNLEVRRGDVIAVIGASGCGKSTLLRCINMLEKPDGGEIKLDGEVVFKSSLHALKQKQNQTDKKSPEYSALKEECKLIGKEEAAGEKKRLKLLNSYREKTGMVFQQFNLFPHLTVMQNITLAPMKLKKTPKELAESQAIELLNKVGLAEKSGAYPSTLSGGQKQRIAIVRALAMQPEIMLFDEPTSALDPEMVSEVVNVMIDLARSMTMIVVTHELRFAKNAANRAVFMDNGRICEENSPKLLFNAPQSPRLIDFLSKVL